MTFNEIAKAAHDLIHAFGKWTFENGDKKLKVSYNRDTFDYDVEIVKDGTTIDVKQADLTKVTKCLITYIKEDKIKDYN